MATSPDDYTATKDAWADAKKDLYYAAGTKDNRQAYEQAFVEEFPLGADVIKQEYVEASSYPSQLGSQAKSGAMDTFNAAYTVAEARTDASGLAELVTADVKRRSEEVTPVSLKKAHANMAAESKRWSTAKTVEDKTIAMLRTFGATGKEVIDNPAGVGLLAIRSAPNMVAPLAGAAVGSLAGPAGTAAGMFSGSYTIEEGAAIQEGITKELAGRSLPVTEENVQSIINDEELFSSIKSAASRKAVGTALTDTVLGAGLGRVGSLAKGASKVKNAAKVTGVAAGELASEPISEAAGQLARSGEIDAGELMGETLGGFGSSVGMAPVDIAAFGDKTLTEIKAKPKARNTLKDQVKSKSQYQYKEKVAAAVESGDVTEISDVDSDKADPVMAIDVLRQRSQKETGVAPKLQNLDQAQGIYKALDQKKQKLVAEATKLTESPDSDPKEVKDLIDDAKSVNKIMKHVEPLIKSMQDVGADQGAILEQINQALKSDDSTVVQESILSIFGSKRGSDLSDSDTLNSILSNPQIDDSTKASVKLVQEYQTAEKVLTRKQEEPSSKGIKDVHSDIVEGGVGFNGIKTYAQAITLSLQKGDTETAETQLNTLKSFAEGHESKADTFTIVYNAGISNEPITAEVQAEMDKYDTERANRGFTNKYNLNTKNAEGLVNTIILESDALNKAVAMMDSWMSTAESTITPITPATVTDEISGSGATESITEVGDVAVAKETSEVIDEGSTRTGTEAGTIAVVDKIETKEPTKQTKEESKIEPITKETSDFQKSSTTKTDSDPTNKVKSTFKPKKTKGIIHRTDNVLEVMTPEHLETTEVFNEKNPMDDAAKAVISSISDFGSQFTKAFHKEFKVKAKSKTGKDFRFEDPIQFLLNDDGTMPSSTIDALMAASYKWVAARSTETVLNRKEDIWAILGLEEDAPIDRMAHYLLDDIGVTATMLQESLGKDVFELLGIQVSDASDASAQNKLELSLGLQAIATMQAMGILDQKDVLRGAIPGQESNSVTGLTGLINKQTDSDSKLYSGLENNFFVPEGPGAFQSYKGSGFITFYRIATENGDIKKSIFDIVVEPHQKSLNTWDRIFKGENDKRNYSFEPIKKSTKPMKMKGTDYEVSKEQQDNIETSQAKPYKASTRTMGFYSLLSEDNLAKIQGAQDPETTHIENTKTTEGINSGLKRSNAHVQAWLVNAANQESGYNSEFHIPQEFWRQGRMGQIGDINPQGDKNHRFLFNMSAWENDVDLTDQVMKEQFLEAVALGLDLEVSKEGGLDQTISKLQEKLEEPVFQKAITAINTILTGRGDMNELVLDDPEIKKYYKKEIDAITEATIEGGVNMHSFKALIEYTRYRNAVVAGDTSFNTDLTTEIDGVSNGPTIARIQLMLDSADVGETLTALQNAGISFSNAQPGLAIHLARNLSYDAYKRTGFAWTEALVQLQKELSNDQNAAALEAMNNLFGSFRNDDGTISGIVRNLSKDPTLKTVYGMGKKALIKELQESFVSSIYSKMEKAVVNQDIAALKTLNNNLYDVAGRYVFGKDSTDVLSNGVIDNQAVLTTKLTTEDITAINENIEQYHGAALDMAIKQVYGKMKDAFKPLNTGIGMTAVLYNSVLKIKTQQVEALAAKEDREVTVGEMDAITESVKEMFPRVTTKFGKEIPLAKKSREKDYSNKAKGVINREVQQSYKTLAGKKAAPYAKSGLQSPGVGGTILTIHNQDSVVANTVMGVHDILNNHDGFTTGVGQAHDMGVTANETFYNTVKDFHMGEELFESMQGIVREFTKHKAELIKSGITAAEINNIVAEEFKAMGTKSYQFPGAEKATTMNADTLKDITKSIVSEMGRVAKETKKNKEILVNVMTAVEQYSFEGAAYKPETSPNKLSFNGEQYNPLTITETAEKRLTGAIKATDEVAKSIGKVAVETVGNEIGSSPAASQMSIDPTEYNTQQEVSGMNVLDVYNNIKDGSTISASPEHDAHLQSILVDVAQKVMDPVDVFLTENPNLEPEGKFVHIGSAKSKVFISSQNRIIGPVSGSLNQGLRMSTGEVYTHEILHSVVHTGLNMNKRLRAKVERLFNTAEKSLGKDGYKAFLNNPNPNQFELQAAKDRYDYVFRNTEAQKTSEFYQGVDPATGIPRVQERSNYLDEFLVLALTNENFGKALSGIKLSGTQYNSKSWKTVKGNNIQETLGNIAQLIMDFLFQKFTTTSSAASIESELKNLAILLSKKDTKSKSALYLSMIKAGEYAGKASEYGNKFIKSAVTSVPVIKTLKTTKETLTALQGSDTSIGRHMRQIENAYDRLDQGLIKSMVTEIRGRTDRMAWLHKLLSRRQNYLDQAKQQASDTMVASTNEAFQNPLTDEEKTAFTKVGLKTDASVLNSSLGSDGLLSVLRDPKELRKQIDSVLKKIANNADLAPYTTYYQRASDALGHFMIHSRSRSGEVVFQSARVIAALRNTDKATVLTEDQINTAEALVDQLASLYAIKYTSSGHKNTFANLLEKDSEGVNKVFGFHEVLKAESLDQAFNGNKYKFIKGYTKQILNSRINIKYGTILDEAQFAEEGYVRTPKPLDRDDAEVQANGGKPVDMFMYTSRVAKVNDLLSTIFSYTGNVAKGTTPTDIARSAGLPGKMGDPVNSEIVRKKNFTIQDMTDPTIVPELDNGNFMVPQVDDKGDVVGYRYMMTEETKDSHIEQVTDVTKILGSMAGQVIDKVRSPEINQELITGLHAVYKEGYQRNPEGFVEVGPNSEDPKLREIYYMMPPKAKKDIQKIWGSQGIFMPKDFVDISFGYRQYSITDAFTKTPEDRAKMERIFVGAAKMLFKDKAVQRAGSLESIFTELTKLAKSNIIIKSLHVTLNNLGSNMVYLRSRGVPVSTIMKLGWEAISMGNKYQIDSKNLDKALLRKKATMRGKYTANQIKDIDVEIARLRNSIARNPTTKTIQAGLMPSLVDDIETVTSGSNFPTEFEKKVTAATDKLPAVVKKVGKVIALTEDTQAFKVLNNAVKMTDFIGRHVLYNQYTKDGMGHEEAIASVEDEFVNFNIPTHQMIEYGNKIGVLWFTKYAMRILKVIKESVTDKPFDVFMAYMISTHAGMDNILNSTPTGIDDIINHAGNPIDAFTGSIDELLTINGLDQVLQTGK